MNRGFYTSLSGMLVSEARQGVIQNNLANINTYGYKGEELLEKSFNEVMIKNYDNYENGINKEQKLGNMTLGIQVDEVVLEHSQGSFKPTDKNTDFALEGPGFFAVESNINGQTNQYYTRNGNFKVDLSGYLVDSNGARVIGTNLQGNGEGPIYVGDGNISINQFGEISVNGQNQYKFKVVDFENYAQAKKEGNNLISYNGELKASNAFVRQGELELSNIKLNDQYTDMIMTQRSFESNYSVLKTVDEMNGKAISELGRLR